MVSCSPTGRTLPPPLLHKNRSILQGDLGPEEDTSAAVPGCSITAQWEREEDIETHGSLAVRKGERTAGAPGPISAQKEDHAEGRCAYWRSESLHLARDTCHWELLGSNCSGC